MESFRFLDAVSTYAPADTYVAHMSADVKTKEDFLRDFEQKLHCPGFFARNWDGVTNRLRNFGWLEHQRVALVFETLPAFDDNTMEGFLRTLFFALEFWSRLKQPALEVAFPESERQAIHSLLQKYGITLQPTFHYSDIGPSQDINDHFSAVLPAGISNEQKLMKALGEQLHFPEYFGANWDALGECLRDFHWIKEGDVALIHSDLPALNERDISLYLHILDWSVRDWWPSEMHRFSVQFPKGCKERVEMLLQKGRC